MALETTEIEKKHLEAHVELCAERYNTLEKRIEDIDGKICRLHTAITEIRDMIEAGNRKRNDQLITWGLGLIGGLVAMVGWLLAHYVLK